MTWARSTGCGWDGRQPIADGLGTGPERPKADGSLDPEDRAIELNHGSRFTMRFYQERRMNQYDRGVVKAELDRLTNEFFRAVSFEEDGSPRFEDIHTLFIETGLLIKNTASKPEISTVSQFIEPRQTSVRSGELTRFNEAELSESTEIFGNVAHRFSSYTKSGTMKSVPFVARGMISTQFILTPAGWKISAMAWDDERPGLSILEQYEPKAINSR